MFIITLCELKVIITNSMQSEKIINSVKLAKSVVNTNETKLRLFAHAVGIGNRARLMCFGGRNVWPA